VSATPAIRAFGTTVTRDTTAIHSTGVAESSPVPDLVDHTPASRFVARWRGLQRATRCGTQSKTATTTEESNFTYQDRPKTISSGER
jgi:hypothetical protein